MSISVARAQILDPRIPAEATAVVDFWRDAGADLWFAKDPDFDRRFHDRFIAAYEMAAAGGLTEWTATAEGALALTLLLDQFPRNAFRGTARMYATDARARAVADLADRRDYARAVDPDLAVFLLLPFGHSEDPGDQERSVALAAALGPVMETRAMHHRDLVRRFGRFPHRNPILGRQMTAEEQAHLDGGGYAG